MTVENVTLVAGVYITGAVIISLLAGFGLDQRLKACRPANRPYMWGFFFGCMCIAFLPLAALSAVETVAAGARAKWAAYQVHGVYTLVFALTAVSGWSILRRKRWAWILGTLLGPVSAFPVLRDLVGPDVAPLGLAGYLIWLVNYVYGRKRWAEFHQHASAPATAKHKPFEPVRLLTSLEAKAVSQDVSAQPLQDTIHPPERSPTPPIPAAASTQAARVATEGSLAPVFGPPTGGDETRAEAESQPSKVLPAP